MLDKDSINVMDVRPLLSCDGAFDSLPVTPDSAPSLALPRPDDSTISFLHTSSWLVHPANDHVLCLLVSATATKVTHLRAYRILSLGESQEVTLPSAFPIAISAPSAIFTARSILIPSRNHQIWRSPSIGRFLMTYISSHAQRRQLAIVGCQFGPSASSPLSSAKIVISKCSSHSLHSFCYATGRMVSFEESHIPGAGIRRELRIMDFLGPKSFYDV